MATVSSLAANPICHPATTSASAKARQRLTWPAPIVVDASQRNNAQGPLDFIEERSATGADRDQRGSTTMGVRNSSASPSAELAAAISSSSCSRFTPTTATSILGLCRAQSRQPASGVRFSAAHRACSCARVSPIGAKNLGSEAGSISRRPCKNTDRACISIPDPCNRASQPNSARRRSSALKGSCTISGVKRLSTRARSLAS